MKQGLVAVVVENGLTVRRNYGQMGNLKGEQYGNLVKYNNRNSGRNFNII